MLPLESYLHLIEEDTAVQPTIRVEGQGISLFKVRKARKINLFHRLLSFLFRFEIERNPIKLDIYLMEGTITSEERRFFTVLSKKMYEEEYICFVRRPKQGIKDCYEYFVYNISIGPRNSLTRLGWNALQRRCIDLGLKPVPVADRPFYYKSKWARINTKEEVLKYTKELAYKYKTGIYLRIENNKTIKWLKYINK